MKIKTYPLSLILATVALAACQDTLTPDAALDDTAATTPVTLRMELAGAATTVNTRAIDATTIANTPAAGEITAETEFAATGSNTLTLLLPSAEQYQTSAYVGTIGNGKWQDLPAQLYLKDFTARLNPSAVAYGTTATDHVYATATRDENSTYNLKLQHATAKVSILLKDKSGSDFTGTVSGITLQAASGTYQWTDGKTFGTALIEWMNADVTRQPEFTFTATGTMTYKAMAQTGFWNVLIPPTADATVTVKLTDNTAYSIALTAIKVGESNLTNVAPNQHLLLTLTLDRLTGLNVTNATIGDWTRLDTETIGGDDDTSGAMNKKP